MTTRKNLPSASGFHRLLRCPGSHALERSLPPQPENADAARDGGQLIHDALAGNAEALAQLTPEQLELKEDCERTEYQRAEKLINIDEPHAVYREQRYWLHDDDFRPIFSGQPDIVRVQGRTAVVSDYKSGWVGALPAEQNAQIMCLAVLVRHQWDVDRVFGLIIQPHAYPRVSVVEYGPADLDNAERVIRETLKKASQPDAPRQAGEHCKFCTAKLHCKEYQARALAVELYGESRELTHAQLLTMFDHWAVVKGLGAQLETTLKTILKENPDAFGGKLKLKEGAERPVIDTGKAWQSLSGVFTAEEFIQFCDVSITPMRKKLKYKRETIEKQKFTMKQAIEEIDRLLGDAVVYRKNQPSLERAA